MCEPLKGKKLEMRYGYEDTLSFEGFDYNDVKFAVEGIRKELRDWCDDIAQKSAVDAMINKWFEDVIE